MQKCFSTFLICCLSLVFLSPPATSQSYEQQRNQVFAYNILFNGLIGGVGGAINKPKHEKFLITFGKNFLKGALGGGIKYMAKYDVYYINQIYTYSAGSMWSKPNRLLYYLGHSFVTNASLNRELWHSYYCQFYGVNMQFQFKDGFKVNSRISVSSTYWFIKFAIEKNKFNLYKSMEYGLFYFDLNIPKYPKKLGVAGTDAIVISQNSMYKNVFTVQHEIIHTYQYSDYFPLSNIFDKYLNKVKEKKLYSITSKYIYLDIPYFSWFYQLQPKPVYYKNFYEFEAQHFATRKYVVR